MKVTLSAVNAAQAPFQRRSAKTSVTKVVMAPKRHQQAHQHRALGAPTVGEVAGPEPGDERGRELAASHQSDHKRAQTEDLVHVQRHDWQRKADDEESDEDHRHDRQQGQHDRARPGLRPGNRGVEIDDAAGHWSFPSASAVRAMVTAVLAAGQPA